MRLMNALPISDLITFLLHGGLNPMTSLRLFFYFGGLCGVGFELKFEGVTVLV